jgi:ATP-dependent RNA helicase DeaD
MAVPTLTAPRLPRTVFADPRIPPDLQRILGTMGITTPTPIQAAAIPALLDRRDLIGQAQTGSGKTLAFALPLVLACDPRIRQVQGLVLTPTRELAQQVAAVARPFAASRGLRLALLHGGRSLVPERQSLLAGPHLVVATPGRALDHLRRGNFALEALRFLVLDEGDQMLDQGFAPDVERILALTPRRRQTALFSATIPAWVVSTAAKHLQDPVTVRVDPDAATPPEIAHTVYQMETSAKLSALRTLLDRRGAAPMLVFARTKHGVKKLARQLAQYGYPVAPLQGNMSQGARDRAMAGFRAGETPILVATNVAARGLDVDGIGQVINYELPESAELFSHRSGRTGRMGRQGEVITFLTPDDAAKWRQLERELGRRFARKTWPATRDAEGAGPGAPRPSSVAPDSTPSGLPTPMPRRRVDPRRRSNDARPPGPGRGVPPRSPSARTSSRRRAGFPRHPHP